MKASQKGIWPWLLPLLLAAPLLLSPWGVSTGGGDAQHLTLSPKSMAGRDPVNRPPSLSGGSGMSPGIHTLLAGASPSAHTPAPPPTVNPPGPKGPDMGNWTFKRCNPWRCKEVGSTCGGPPYCFGDYAPYQCLSKFTVLECSRLCWHEDIFGRRLGDPFYEHESRQRHAGCCNICNTLDYPPEVKAKPTPRLCLTPPLAPSALPSTPWFLPIGAGKTPGADSNFYLAGNGPTSLPRECDEVVHSECRYTLWRNTGFEYCSFSLWCIFALPPFSGHFIEQEREQICWTRCKNGYTGRVKIYV